MNRAQARMLPVPLPANLPAEMLEDNADSESHPRHAEWLKVHGNTDRGRQARQIDWSERTRIVATYDFTIIRYLLAANGEDEAELPEPVRARMQTIERRLKKHKQSSLSAQLRRSLQTGREIDWSLLEELIRIPHTTDYEVPTHEHGTHVAGILGADWRVTDMDDDMFPASDDVRGLCPDMNLYDLRVLDENGEGDEFNVMAALQFVRYLNAHKDYMVVHGVNLSLSIPGDVPDLLTRFLDW